MNTPTTFIIILSIKIIDLICMTDYYIIDYDDRSAQQLYIPRVILSTTCMNYY